MEFFRLCWFVACVVCLVSSEDMEDDNKPELKEGEEVFRGSFIVKSGDKFSPDLYSKELSVSKEKAEKYERIINAVYRESPVKEAFVQSRIVGFEGQGGGPLRVIFNIVLDTKLKQRVDAGDLFILMADALQATNGTLVMGGSGGGGVSDEIVIDQDSLVIGIWHKLDPA